LDFLGLGEKDRSTWTWRRAASPLISNMVLSINPCDFFWKLLTPGHANNSIVSIGEVGTPASIFC